MSDGRRIDRVEGSAIPLRGANIDTDRVIPARFLKSVTFEGLGEHVFEDDRKSTTDHPFSEPRYRRASILLTNENFGSGSSREHAPQALMRWGLAACVGESFSEIFQANALVIGLPCATADATDIEYLMRCAEQDANQRMVLCVSELTLQVLDRTISVAMPPTARQALLNGTWDATGLLLDQFHEVRTVAARLPYVKAFR